jgi:hypothetical protein
MKKGKEQRRESFAALIIRANHIGTKAQRNTEEGSYSQARDMFRTEGTEVAEDTERYIVQPLLALLALCEREGVSHRGRGVHGGNAVCVSSVGSVRNKSMLLSGKAAHIFNFFPD